MASNIDNLDIDISMLEAARSGDENALNHLIKHYEPEIRMIASKYFLPRADFDDLIQEGRIAIYRAIISYNKDSGIPFPNFLRMVIKRKLIDSLRKYNRQKHTNLNQAYSLNKVISDSEGFSFLELMPKAEDPALTVIAHDEVTTLIQDLNKNLSKLERLVFEHYFIQGFKQRELSDYLGLHTKTLDNAIQRIRHKSALYRSRQAVG